MQQHHHQPKPLLVEIDAAAVVVSFAAATVREWAYGKRPAPAGFPAPVRIAGGHRQRPTLRYRLADLVQWVESLGASDAAAPAAPPASADLPAGQAARRSPGRPRNDGRRT